MTPNIADIIRHHVSLEVRCVDRLYLHAYLPKLQTSGGLCYFLRDHLGHPIPSPALFKPLHDRFVTAVERFVAEVDSAAVMVNASTRFTDGEEFGFGAEIGISTQKLHARGPMALRELTTYKYVVWGDGQIRN